MPTASAAVLSVRVNASERALLEAAAEQASTSLSDFVRRRALEAAESDLLKCEFEAALTTLMNFPPRLLEHPELVITTANTDFACVDDAAVARLIEKFQKLNVSSVDEIGAHIARTRSARVFSKLKKLTTGIQINFPKI